MDRQDATSLPDADARSRPVLRIALVGAESTGKTTLARQLAAHYKTAWVPEYGRPYWEGLLPSSTTAYTTLDFVHIAEVQAQMEDMLARHANRVLICDTDAFTTWLWHELYLGHDGYDPAASPMRPAVSAPGMDASAIRTIADRHRHALHILAGDEIPWEDDGTRDRPQRRHWFQERFRQELARTGRRYVEISGRPEARLAKAVAVIDRLLAERG
jgi:NadR type nicotinamide-nucleotide adenylyltransferase